MLLLFSVFVFIFIVLYLPLGGDLSVDFSILRLFGSKCQPPVLLSEF